MLSLILPRTRPRIPHGAWRGADVVRQVLVTNASRKSALVTDESAIYTKTGKAFADHQTMVHSGREYKKKSGYTTNNVENFFLQFKCGMRSTYIHCGA